MKRSYIITENNVEKLCKHGPATWSESNRADREVF
jgi:hypothetical protein